METGLLISISGLLAVTCLLITVGFLSLRTALRPLGYWLAGWATLLVTAALSLAAVADPNLQLSSFFFGSLVSPLMWMGARAHVGQVTTYWMPALALGLGLLRVTLALAIGTHAALWVALAAEPAIAIAAFAVITAEKRSTDATRRRGNIALGAGFLLLAAAEAYDAIADLRGDSTWGVWAAWIGCGVPLLTVQVSLYLDSISKRAASSERERHAHEERLRIFTEASESLVVEYDAQGILTYVNANTATRLGQPVDDIVGRNASELCETRVDSPIKRALDEKGFLTEADINESRKSPFRAAAHDADLRWYEATRACYRTEEGELRIVTHALDVTDRVSHEKSMAESERRSRRAEEIGNFGSWEYHAATGEIFWSDHLYRIHGLEPGDGPVDPKATTRLIQSDDLRRIVAEVSRRKDVEEDARFPELEYRIKRARNGETRYLKTLGEFEFDESGELERITGAILDITEQKLLEDALRLGRERLDLLIGSNIVGVLYVTSEFSITEANDAFLGILGFQQEDLPLSWTALTPEAGRERDDVARRSLITSGVALPYEKDFIAKNGELVPFEIGCARIDADSAIVIAVDLSDRKRAEAYVAEKQVELEETLSARTRELLMSRSRLIEAERLAAVGTLAAGVAHQINNPIGAILNTSEFALLCREDQNALEVFSDALESNLVEARRCALIVRSMLQFTRDEPSDKWSEDLNRMVLRANRAIASYATDRDAQVSVHTPPETIHAICSPIEIEQAIVNVLRNALESRERGARVSLSLTRRDKYAEIEVIDDGRGIDQANRDHLFEPFFTTRTRLGGTGLGLSVAHGIINDHGGEIIVADIPSGGTRVVIKIPVSDEESSSAPDREDGGLDSLSSSRKPRPQPKETESP